MAIDLDNALIWPMRDGYPRGRRILGYAPRLIPLRSASNKPRFLASRDLRMPRGFGKANCPYAAGNAADPAGGYVFDSTFTPMIESLLDAGRTVRIAIAIQGDNPDTMTTGGDSAPPFQCGHATGKVIFRVRYQATELETWIAEDDGNNQSRAVHATTFDDVYTWDGNLTEWYIQFTPNDPALSAETHKHNLYVTVRTTAPDGTGILSIVQHAHYTPGSAASFARVTGSALEFTIGKNLASAVTDGVIGDYLGIVIDGGADGSVETNTTTIGSELDTLWSRAAKYITRRDARCRSRAGTTAA